MRKLFVVSIILIPLVSFQIFSQTWSSPKRLTWNGGSSEFPAIATDSGSGIHIAWDDYTSGDYEIFYKRSSDGGTTWSGLTRLTWNADWSRLPAIATLSGGGIHIVWEDKTPGNYEIFYKYSTDSGNTWSTLKRLTWNAGASSRPAIAVDSSSGIHVVWCNDTDTPQGFYEIFYKSSTDGGATWSGPTRLTWNAGFSWSPSIAADSSNRIHVVWSDTTPGNAEIFYKHSPDTGATWSSLTRLTWNSGSSGLPTIAADSSNVIHVVWQDDTPGNDEIFYKRWTSAGVPWSGPIRLSWNSGNSFSPFIAADSATGIHVAWYDNSPGNNEVFFKHSTDGGSNWSGFQRLTWNSGDSNHPTLATDSGNTVHMVWYDDTPGNFEIFYKNRK